MDEFQQNNLMEGEAPKAPSAPSFERDATPSYNSAPSSAPVYTEEPVSLGSWVGMLLLGFVPCVNLIMLFVWAFSDGKKSRQNWARASLIVTAIIVVLYMIFVFTFGAALVASMSQGLADIESLM